MTVEDDVEAFLVDRATERNRRYVDEGRCFKSVTDDDLRRHTQRGKSNMAEATELELKT